MRFSRTNQRALHPTKDDALRMYPTIPLFPSKTNIQQYCKLDLSPLCGGDHQRERYHLEAIVEANRLAVGHSHLHVYVVLQLHPMGTHLQILPVNSYPQSYGRALLVQNEILDGVQPTQGKFVSHDRHLPFISPLCSTIGTGRRPCSSLFQSIELKKGCSFTSCASLSPLPSRILGSFCSNYAQSLVVSPHFAQQIARFRRHIRGNMQRPVEVSGIHVSVAGWGERILDRRALL